MFTEGTKFDLHALILDKKTGTTKTGKPYADLTIRADTGDSLKCKIWNYTESTTGEITKVGNVARVLGDVSTYNGELQGVITCVLSSNREPSEFAKKTRLDISKMWEVVEVLVESFTEPMTKYIAKHILAECKDEFLKAPAATDVHHAWVGGLLEHTTAMAEIAIPIIRLYQKRYGESKISRDKILFGVLMHDLAKIFEYDLTTPAFRKTRHGILVGHITKCAIMISEAAKLWYTPEAYTLDQSFTIFEQEKDYLIHLVLSHHGQTEWGSPIVPCTLEAVLLHHIDLLDSQFMHALTAVEGKEGDVPQFSEKSWVTKTRYLQG